MVFTKTQFLIVYLAGLVATSKAAAGLKYNLYADFNMGGVKGVILFQQEDNVTPVLIKVQMETFESGPWAIRQYPFFHSGNASSSCNDLGEVIDQGDLTKSHGEFGYKSSYIDPNLKLYGKQTLLGRSVVIYEKDGMTVKACGNILEFNASMMYASAVLHGAVSGKVSIIRSTANPNSPSVILGELFYVDGTKVPTDGHSWYIGETGVLSYKNCSLVGNFFSGPSMAGKCRPQDQSSCAPGDLTGKHGTISIGIAGKDKILRRRFRFVDNNLRISPPLSVISRGLVIQMNGKGISCGDFITRGPIMAEASFDAAKHVGVFGSILFRQSTPFHATKITVHLEGLHYHADAYHIHEFPIPDPEPETDMCSVENVGAHLNPLSVDATAFTYPAPGTATLDEYEAGDISGKFGVLVGKDSFYANYSDHQISLYGRNSILGRALVIHEDDGENSRWVCANILPRDSIKLSARANFTESSELDGYIDLEQYIQSNGVTTDTGITVSIKYKDGPTKTFEHNWHTHIDPVGNDSRADMSSRCASVKGHYNPYNVSVTDDYGLECTPEYSQRCELGDLSSRQEKYGVGVGKKYFVDEDFTLFGATTAIGRSFTIHEENGGHGRLACASIIATENLTAPPVIYDLHQPTVAPQ